MSAKGLTGVGIDVPMTAGEDLSSSQYCVVKLHTTSGQVVKAGGTDTPFGVLQNKPESGEEAKVRVAGTTQIKANGPFSLGDHLVVAAATGRVDTAAAGGTYYLAEAQYIVGIALEAATAGADEVRAIIRMFEAGYD
jgi:hypothetical protein